MRLKTKKKYLNKAMDFQTKFKRIETHDTTYTYKLYNVCVNALLFAMCDRACSNV